MRRVEFVPFEVRADLLQTGCDLSATFEGHVRILPAPCQKESRGAGWVLIEAEERVVAFARA